MTLFDDATYAALRRQVKSKLRLMRDAVFSEMLKDALGHERRSRNSGCVKPSCSRTHKEKEDGTHTI